MRSGARKRTRWGVTLAVVCALVMSTAAPAWADVADPTPSPTSSEEVAPDTTPTPTPEATPSPEATEPAPDPTPTPTASPTDEPTPTPTASPEKTTPPDDEAGAPAAPRARSLLREVTPFLLPGADPTASLSIQKVASTATVSPGQTFSYTIQFQCTAGTVNGCVNATVTDPLPSHLTIVGAPLVTGTTNYDASGTTATELNVTFTDPLGGGQVGLAPGNVVVVQLQVRVENPLDPALDGTTLSNTAAIEADNAATKQSSADVALQVPFTLGATTTKEISPAGGPNDTTSVATTTITGTNTSNVPVQQLVITDPVLQDDGTPPTDDNPFEFIRTTQLNQATPPAGADTVQVRVYDSSLPGWVAGPVLTLPADPAYPPGVDPADITGVQIIYADTDGAGIPPGASATLSVDFSLRDVIPDEQLPLVITNTADTTVIDADGGSATSDPASATYRVPPSTLDIGAAKSFSPSVVRAGDPTTMRVQGINESDEPLDTMTITEPANGTLNHFEDGLWTFTSMGSPAGSGIVWPDGANTATITYQCDGSPGDPITTSAVNTLPQPPADCDPVTGYSVTFSGTISPGATATIPAVITTNPDQPTEELLRTNIVGVHGQAGPSSGDATALALIRTILDRIAVDVSKTLTPSTIPSFPGQIVTAQLSGKLLPFPDSTVDATTIVVQDPATIPDPNQWYDSFDPQAVTATPVASCSTLDVQYTVDGTTWLPIPGMSGIQGATIFNGVIPDEIGEAAIGIRFVYTAAPAGGQCTGGFPPGTSVSPNLSYTLDASMADSDATLVDCAASQASSRTTPDAAAGPACDDVVLVPPDPGTIDPIDKTWDRDAIPERSGEEAGATLSWSTNGYTGVGRADITDTQNPESTPVAGSVFDTFDLVRIDAITPALDPLLTYDQVTQVLLYTLDPGSTDPTEGQWIPAPGDPCPTACDGTFPGYTIPDNLRSQVIGFRLTYIESPTRVNRLDSPTAPPVGSGVAASTGNNRHIHPVFQLRDVRRSDSSVPVVAGELYNTADEGLVLNTVRADAYWNVDDPEPVLSRTDGDTILITNVDITATSTKTWTGGPLGIPDEGVPQNLYPTSRVTVTGANTSPSKVDRLVIADPDTTNVGPDSCTTSAFDTFNLSDFVSITAPGDIGASGVTVTLSRGAATTDYTRDQALALTEAQLADVTGYVVTYTGRINAGSTPSPTTATVVFDVRLRTADRTSGAAPRPGTVCNQTRAQAADMVDFDGFTDSQDAYSRDVIQLVDQGIGVTPGKSFTPTFLTEPDTGPVTVRLTGQPSGPSRTVQLVLEDTSPTFFNQYDFAGFQSIAGVNPVDQVRADVYVGGTWSLAGGVPVVSGGHWETGSTVALPATPSLPGGVTAAQVQGVRFTFSRADGSNWENPANPIEPATFQVTRRSELHTGGPVQTDLGTPAPGETVAGVATNTVTATAISSDVDANGDPLTASADTSATLAYRHASNSVVVRKTPVNDIKVPGTPFRYTMTFTNNGQVDIVDPVITDIFPADASGPQITLAPDPAYQYAMTGGTGMPTDPAEVSVAESTTGVVFTFPAGSTIPRNATYTVSFQAVTRPGLAAGTVFTNTVGITADRPWDACDGGSGGGLDATTGQCRAVAPNTVTSAGALYVSKRVQAEGSDVLGVAVDPLYVGPRVTASQCVADGAGFYGRPCIPIGEPGGDVTWRLHFLNSGNLPLSRVLGIDRLPAPGDAVATAPELARLSQWHPLLSGVRPEPVGVTGTYAVYYTTATTGWCDAPEATDGQLLCPALGWTEWPAGTALPIDPAAVTGLQFEIVPDTPLAPAAEFDIDLPMIAPPYSPADTPNTDAMSEEDTFAFNSVGSTARYVVGGTPRYTLTTEPPRVGVGLAHGGLRIEKLVDGYGDVFAPDEFAVTLSCTSAGVDVPLPDDVASLTLSADTPVTIYDLPYHATCTLVEGDNGQSSSTSTTATVERDIDDFETATLTNTYDAGALQIVKTLTGGGAANARGPFVFSVVCTIGDGEVPYSDTVTLERSGTSTTLESDVIGPLPVGAQCTVAETANGGADATPDPVTVTILPSADGVVQVAFANFVNVFTPLPITGGLAPAWWLVAIALVLVLVGLGIVVVRRLSRRL